VAPAEGTASFLAASSLLTDGGRVMGPAIVAVVAGRWGLDTAAVVLAATMTAGLVWLCLVVGETGRGGDPCTS